MTDARLKGFVSLEGTVMDMVLRDDGRLDDREELATAVRVALGTDALSAADEILPDPDSTDRRGWWGNLDAEEIWGGWPIGCKNWLLLRAKITDAPSSEGSTVHRARQYTQDALQPFIEKRIASRINVQATRIDLNRIDVDVIMYRGSTQILNLRTTVIDASR